ALNVQVAKERFVPAGEGEPGHGCGDADVDADHAGVKAAFEIAGGPAAGRKDARAVAVFALPAERQGLVEIADADDRKHRHENLFTCEADVGLYAIDDARTKQKAFVRQVELTAVERDISSFAFRNVEICGHAIAMRAGNQRPHIDLGTAVGWTNLHR